MDPPLGRTHSVSLFYFPLFDLGSLFIQPQIAVVAGRLYAPLPHCRRNGAAGFLAVGAVVELALADIRPEVRESILQVSFRITSIWSVSKEEKPGVSAT